MKRSRKTLFALLLALVMTLGLTATAWATGGDEPVGGDGIPVGPVVDPGTGNYPPTTELKIPFIKKVTLGGNTAPGETEFKLEIFDIGNSTVDCKNVPYTAAVTTNGARSYEGTLIISGTAEQIRNIVCEGFFVREVNDRRSGWTYSDAVWHVMPSGEEDGNGIPKMNIYPTTMEKRDDGEFYVPDMENPKDEMTFENVYTYNHTTQAQRPAEKPNTPETAITAPKTFDAGVALYGVSALLSLTGTALLIKRKNG